MGDQRKSVQLETSELLEMETLKSCSSLDEGGAFPDDVTTKMVPSGASSTPASLSTRGHHHRRSLQRQVTRFGLTSDEEGSFHSFDDCLDEFLRRCVFPLLALLAVLLTFSQVVAAPTWLSDRVVCACAVVLAQVAATALVVR